MKYELIIRQLEEYTPEEQKETKRERNYPLETYPSNRFSDKNFHELRVLYVEVTEKEFEAIKKAVIAVV
jgi:hypothetical protein